jgi:hypothetical protein
MPELFLEQVFSVAWDFTARFETCPDILTVELHGSFFIYWGFFSGENVR